MQTRLLLHSMLMPVETMVCALDDALQGSLNALDLPGEDDATQQSSSTSDEAMALPMPPQLLVAMLEALPQHLSTGAVADGLVGDSPRPTLSRQPTREALVAHPESNGTMPTPIERDNRAAAAITQHTFVSSRGDAAGQQALIAPQNGQLVLSGGAASRAERADARHLVRQRQNGTEELSLTRAPATADLVETLSQPQMQGRSDRTQAELVNARHHAEASATAMPAGKKIQLEQRNGNVELHYQVGEQQARITLSTAAIAPLSDDFRLNDLLGARPTLYSGNERWVRQAQSGSSSLYLSDRGKESKSLAEKRAREGE